MYAGPALVYFRQIFTHKISILAGRSDINILVNIYACVYNTHAQNTLWLTKLYSIANSISVYFCSTKCEVTKILYSKFKTVHTRAEWSIFWNGGKFEEQPPCLRPPHPSRFYYPANAFLRHFYFFSPFYSFLGSQASFYSLTQLFIYFFYFIALSYAPGVILYYANIFWLAGRL